MVSEYSNYQRIYSSEMITDCSISPAFNGGNDFYGKIAPAKCCRGFDEGAMIHGTPFHQRCEQQQYDWLSTRNNGAGWLEGGGQVRAPLGHRCTNVRSFQSQSQQHQSSSSNYFHEQSLTTNRRQIPHYGIAYTNANVVNKFCKSTLVNGGPDKSSDYASPNYESANLFGSERGSNDFQEYWRYHRLYEREETERRFRRPANCAEIAKSSPLQFAIHLTYQQRAVMRMGQHQLATSGFGSVTFFYLAIYRENHQFQKNPNSPFYFPLLFLFYKFLSFLDFFAN